MICPECNTVTKYRSALPGLKCSGCKYQYALNPKEMPVGDRRIHNVAEKLSKGGRYFTEQQLGCACLIKKERKVGTQFGYAIIVVITGIAFSINFGLGGSGFLCALVLGGLSAFVFRHTGSKEKLWHAVQLYCSEKGHPFLVTPENAKTIIDRLEKKKELTFEDFKPDKALIVDDTEFAALLLLNNFHRDNNCIVLSMDKKPNPLFNYFVRLQQSDEKVKVFALHDGGSQEELMVSKINADKAWIGCDEIVDLGLNKEGLSNFSGGTWIQEGTGTIATHRKDQKFLDGKYESSMGLKTSWIFPVDGIPPEKLNPAIQACMLGSFTMLSTEMFAAIGMNPTSTGETGNLSGSGGSCSGSGGGCGGSGYDDFG
jgi:hypothetical protein